MTLGVPAASNDVNGKWVTRDVPIDSDAPLSNIRFCSRFGAPGMQTPNLNNLKAAAQERAELDLSVDKLKSNTVTGSIWLPPVVEDFSASCGPVRVSGCGRLKISDGRKEGSVITFTTYYTVTGSRIPARWIGEIEDDNIRLRTSDTLPCKVSSRLSGGGLLVLQGGIPVNSAGPVSLVYRRGDEAEDRKANGPGPHAAGKWFTATGGQVNAFDLKVNNKGKVSGSINQCGDRSGKIKNGSILGKNLVFETEVSQPQFSVLARTQTQKWIGELVDDNTLIVSSSTTQCLLPSGLRIEFTRVKGTKYAA
jgi:hypothetical protein